MLEPSRGVGPDAGHPPRRVAAWPILARPKSASTGSGYLADLRFWLGLFGLFATATTLMLTLWVLGPTTVMGWKPVVVTSGSMTPTIRTGDIVLIRPHDGVDLAAGTVITYRAADTSLLTHRIASVSDSGRDRTRGDASMAEDSALVGPNQVVGVGALLVPIIGHPAVWAATGRWRPLVLVAVGLAFAFVLSRDGIAPEHDPWASRGLQPRPARHQPRHSRGRTVALHAVRTRPPARMVAPPPLLAPPVLTGVLASLQLRAETLDQQRRLARGAAR